MKKPIREFIRYSQWKIPEVNCGIASMCLPLSPEEIYEQKAARERLHAAVNALSGKQIKRIHAYFFLGMSIAEIAGREGVSRNVVGKSIRGGLKRLERIRQYRDP